MRRDSMILVDPTTHKQNIYQSLIPCGEVKEIPLEEGLAQFNLAVKLFDTAYAFKNMEHMRNREQGE